MARSWKNEIPTDFSTTISLFWASPASVNSAASSTENGRLCTIISGIRRAEYRKSARMESLRLIT
jgi:hypothetical protein